MQTVSYRDADESFSASTAQTEESRVLSFEMGNFVCWEVDIIILIGGSGDSERESALPETESQSLLSEHI